MEGTFIHIDGGTLDLGLVRDSQLNSRGDYQIFGETFENVARISSAFDLELAEKGIIMTGSFDAEA